MARIPPPGDLTKRLYVRRKGGVAIPGGDNAGQAETGQNGVSVGVKEDVVRRDAAMGHRRREAVEIGERGGYGLCVVTSDE